ncbi:hypothetical protein Taro_038001, partial [Colocasia esculenta]|nr:hypothetical protein [Colocasia esculenta]
FTHFSLGSVDTRSKQVDTSPRFQKGRSTLAQSRSTLVPDSRRPSCQTGTAEMGQQVDTRLGQVDTLRLKVKIVNFSIHVDAWDLRDLT